MIKVKMSEHDLAKRLFIFEQEKLERENERGEEEG
jgi:hypothetical protein